MLCSNCKKNEASVLFKQLVDNQVTQLGLCAQCAQAAELPVPASGPLFHLLAQLGGARKTAAGRETVCRACGLRYEEFRRSGMLGCPDCYESFRSRLEQVLKSIHGATRHNGKQPHLPRARKETGRPAPHSPRPEDAARLREQLKAALKTENYEEAARLRDLLRELEGR